VFKRMNHSVIAAVMGSGLALGVSGLALAEPNLSGFWQLKSNVNPAAPALTSWGKRQAAKIKSRDDIDIESVRWCVQQGLPFMMDRSGPLDIIQAPQELVLVGERTALPRHLYAANQPHPDESVFDNTPMGNTQAHWQGDILAADTVGFSGGVGPAGVPRTESGHLTERFQVKGDVLTVRSTWADRKALAKPFVYTLTYTKLPDSHLPVEHYCDPRKNGVGH
jgi:hypothetical protein